MIGPACTLQNIGDILALEQTPYEQALPARSTYGLIAATAARFPERHAFVYLPDGTPETPARRISYRELMAQIHRAANLFRAMGAGPQDAVAILAPNVPETQFALWGAQTAARACPINFMLAPEHIAALLKASSAKLIVAYGPSEELDIWSTLEKVIALHPLPVLRIDADGASPDIGADFASEAGRSVRSFQQALAEQSAELSFDAQLTPDRVAACFHTGGTTGAPKLALHTHGNEAHTAWFAHRYYGFDENTVEINGFPLFHVAGAFVYGLALLAIGATQVLPTPSGMRNAAFNKNYWKFCARERVTALACVPTIMASLINLPLDADISTVQVAYTGGSPLPSELAAQFERKLGIPVRNILGMTECAGLVSIEPAHAPRVPGSAGLRLPYTQVMAVPWRDGRAQLGDRCAPGQTGVIVVQGPHVSPGYSDAARNVGMFEGGWLVSGDLGHIDNAGRIHITGRAKDLIIRGSHNIDPALVEEAFLGHPAVALCAVVGEPDAHAGELPVAFVTLKPGAAIDASVLLAQVAPHVYERPATPKRLSIIEAMPLTAVGKIYKPTLRVLAAQTKLQELLGAVAEKQGGVALRVSMQEREGAPLAQVDVAAPFNPALEEKLRGALGAVAMVVDLRWA